LGVIGWFVFGFALLGLAFIIWTPQYIIPNSNSSKYDEIIRVATTRNAIRSTIAQIVVGLAFVATFIQGSVNFSADYKQKADLATADQFAKAFSQLKETPDDTWATIGNFYILANIAESDLRYHEPVYGALSQFIVQHSRLTCGTGSVRDAGATQRDVYRQNGYLIAPVLQTAIRLFVDRTRDKQTQRQFNLEGACLANADLYAAEGLSWVFMPNARLLRVNAMNSKFVHSDLRGIETGVKHNANWNDDYEGIGAWSLHNVAPERLARIRANFEGAEFQAVQLDGSGFEGANLKGAKFIDSNLPGVNFELADLTGAAFSGSNLNGAPLDGANIANADFSTAKKLSVEQLLSACIRVDAEPTAMKSNWPKLPQGMAAEVEAAGGFKLCS
jgi:Pentapeptide repeats (9 copies)